jgi:sporulation protein YlmC with PRC-barrel domain
MFKKALLAATCIATMSGAMSAGALSADKTTAAKKADMATSADTMKKPTHQFDGMTRATEFIGEDVMNGKGEKVGSVDDLIVSTGDQVLYAVLSVGGFLGIGDKLVAVPFKELKVGVKDVDGVIFYDTTKEKLKAQP